jgi:hypothetical protein
MPKQNPPRENADAPSFGSLPRTLSALTRNLETAVAQVREGKRKATVADYLVLRKLRTAIRAAGGTTGKVPRQIIVMDPWQPAPAEDPEQPA